jgi:glycerol kinase
MAGLAVGYWASGEDLRANWSVDRRFEPSIDTAASEALRARWRRAIERARAWDDSG